MRDKATIDKIFKWADKNRAKYETEYQLSGSASAMKTYERYADICDICGAAARDLSDEDETRRRIRRMQNQILDGFYDLKKVNSLDKTFTWDEVEEWMRKMMV